MFTVKECTQTEEANVLCRQLRAPAQSGDRIFVLHEDGPRAVGILALRGAKVVLKGVYGDIDAAYRDVMCRALLHVCRDMQPITLRVDGEDDYWLRFGFEKKDGGMEVCNKDVVFSEHRQ